MTERVCRTCGQALTSCACPPSAPPDTLRRAVALQRARVAALQWWATQLVHDDPHIRAQAEGAMRDVLTADEAALAPWIKKRRRRKIDPATFFRLDAKHHEEFRTVHDREPTDVEAAAALSVDEKTYRGYKHPKHSPP